MVPVTVSRKLLFVAVAAVPKEIAAMAAAPEEIVAVPAPDEIADM
jgi:hypothetical protein